MTQTTESAFFQKITEQLPLGVFLIDSTKHIHKWNAWMEEQTQISSHVAIGKTLNALFPDFKHPRFEWALEMIFSCGAPQLLSQVLNNYVIPIPLQFKNAFGILNMQQKVQISMFSINNEELALVTITDVTETAIQEKALLQAALQLQENSHRDPLTNLYNRRFMYIWLNNAFLMAKRLHHPIACLIFDLDHFKKINDTHGHNTGDKVLVDFAKVISQKVRESDIFVRYGGEEFVIILQACTLAAAIELGNFLINIVQQSSIGGLKAGMVTCSAGASVFNVEKIPFHADDLILQADKQLYMAKRQGRNRVC